MEYRERYYFEWRAQMRDRLGYTLRILERGYKGEAEQLYPTGEVMRIVQGAQDDDELAAIKPSELRLSLLCLDSGEPYANLFTLDPLRYRVEVGVERADAAGELRSMILWRGYLSYAEYQQPYANPPYRVELVANDGLAVLKTIPFAEDDGSAYSWRESIVQIIDRCLSHIDGSAAVWPIEPVEAEQAQNTFDLIGLDASAIYAAFDNATPTCYEVLDSILRNFGVQLFQSYGRWEVRRIYSLSDYARPANYQSITEGFGLARNTVSKLYGEQGEPEGLSSSAVLSILPPLRAVAIDRREDEFSTKIVAAADAKRWNGVLTNSPYSAVYSRGERVVLGFDYPHVDGGWAFALDAVVQSANAVELNLSLDIYNRQSLDSTLRLGLFLVPAADDPIEWLRRVSIKDTITGDVNQITIESLVSGYVFETEEWETLPEGTYTCDEVLTPRTIEVTLAPSSRTFYPWLNVAPTALSMQTETITVKAIPNLATKMRPVVLVWWRGDGARPSIDVANMEVSVSLTAGTALPEQGRSEEAISPSGIEDIAYSQLYTDTYDLPISDAMFTPALVEVADGEPIHGFVAPSLNSQLSDIVSRQLRQLRRGTTRQLDGEVYVHEPIDMNTLWRDRDGRIYYTNYIEHHLRRGVYTVQLREMLPLSEMLTQTPIEREMSEVVSLDTSAVYLDRLRRTLYRYDFVTGVSSLLRQSLYPMYLRRGYDAVSVVEVVAEGEEYNLYAYGDSGELLSEVRNVLRVESNNVSASETDSYARSALYNARGEWWMLAGNLTANTAPAAVISIISRDAQIIYEDGRGFGGRVIDSALTLNGFMLDVDYASEGTSRVLFHDMAIHDESEYSTRALGHTILAITDKLVVVHSEAEDLYKVCLVNGARSELNTDYPLFSQRATSAKFADMNNALVLFRYDGGGGILYDARTGDSTVFTAAEIPGLASVWLSSEYICVAEGYTVTRRRVAIGAELADAAALITADGAVFTTVDGRVFMPMAATETTASNGVGTVAEAYHSRHTGEEIDDAVSAVRNTLIPEQERVSAIATNAYDIAAGLRVDVWGDAENKGLTDRIAEAEGGLTSQGERIEKVEKADKIPLVESVYRVSQEMRVIQKDSEESMLSYSPLRDIDDNVLIDTHGNVLQFVEEDSQYELFQELRAAQNDYVAEMTAVIMSAGAANITDRFEAARKRYYETLSRVNEKLVDVNNVRYLKAVFGDARVLDTYAAVLSSIMAVRNAEGNIVAGLYGGGVEQLNAIGMHSMRHGTLMTFAGARSLNDVRDALFRVYENGTIYSGVQRRSKTIIRADNIEAYSKVVGGDRIVDFDKIGSFVEFTGFNSADVRIVFPYARISSDGTILESSTHGYTLDEHIELLGQTIVLIARDSTSDALCCEMLVINASENADSGLSCVGIFDTYMMATYVCARGSDGSTLLGWTINAINI